MTAKKSDYEKQTAKLRKEISSLQKSIKNYVAVKGALLREKKEQLRKMNLEHNAMAIRSMSQIMLDASDSIDLESLMRQDGFRSAFEAFLRREAEGKGAQASVHVPGPAAPAAGTSSVPAGNVPEKKMDDGKGTDKPKPEPSPDKGTASEPEPAGTLSDKEADKPESKKDSGKTPDENKPETVFQPTASSADSAPETDAASGNPEGTPADDSNNDEEKTPAYHWGPPKEVWDGKK